MKAWSNSDTQKNEGFVPEKKLLVAVLQRAVTDFVSGDEEVQQEAYNWLMMEGNGDNDSAEDEEFPLTFDFICEALDFESESLRKAIVLHAKTNGVQEMSLIQMVM